MMPLVKPVSPILRIEHPLARGLRFAFPLTEGFGTARDVVSGLTLTLNGAARWAKGPWGPVFTFGGSSDYANLPADPRFDTTGLSYSFACTFRLDDFADYYVLANRGGIGNQHLDFLTTQTAGNLYRWNSANSGFSPTLGRYYKFLYTFTAASDTNGTETFYIDGAQVNQQTQSIPGSSTAALTIGGIPGWFGYHGAIDAPMLWLRALSASDAKLHAEDPFGMMRPRSTIVRIAATLPRTVSVSGSAGIGVGKTATAFVPGIATATSGIGIGKSASTVKIAACSATSGIGIGKLATSARVLSVTASAGLGVGKLASARVPLVATTTASSGTALGPPTASAYHTPILISATAGLGVGAHASEQAARIVNVSARAHLGIGSIPAGADNRHENVVATAGLAVSAAVDLTGSMLSYRVSAAAGMALDARAGAIASRALRVSATARLGLGSVPSTTAALGVQAASRLTLGASAALSVNRIVVGLARVGLGSAGTAVREVHVSAASGIGVAGTAGSNQFPSVAARSSFQVSVLGSAIRTTQSGASPLGIASYAAARVTLPDGAEVPAGDANQGLRTVLIANVSGSYPMSYAETPGGLLLIANGIDPMIRWDGLSGTADTAGVRPPETPIALGGYGVGTIIGQRVAFQRFLDRFGNPSNLSPASAAILLGRDALIDDVTYNPTTGVVTVRAAGHGLVTGETIIIRGVGGLETVNGLRAVTVLDVDRFVIDGVIATSGSYTQGGSWTWGVQHVVYQNVAIPIESKVVRRQILRNLDGSMDTFYVDIDTTDLTSNIFISERDDESLAAGEAVPLMSENHLPLANRFDPPPAHKAIVASHLGRIFAAGDVTYREGCVLPRLGQATMQGIGTSWRKTFAGRMLYLPGASAAYEITSVDEANQVLTLTRPYTQ